MAIPHRRPDAAARVRGGGVSGLVRFWQTPEGVVIEARVRGLPDSDTGFYAFHIHESPSGGHYDPEGLPHPRHAGDLPPLLARRGGAYLAVVTDQFRLNQVLGRAVVIHANPDDFHSQPSGNPGPMIARGIIVPNFSRS